jgi:hypothetical protein
MHLQWATEQAIFSFGPPSQWALRWSDRDIPTHMNIQWATEQAIFPGVRMSLRRPSDTPHDVAHATLSPKINACTALGKSSPSCTESRGMRKSVVRIRGRIQGGGRCRAQSPLYARHDHCKRTTHLSDEKMQCSQQAREAVNSGCGALSMAWIAHRMRPWPAIASEWSAW